MPPLQAYVPGDSISIYVKFENNPSSQTESAYVQSYQIVPLNLPPVVKRKKGRPPKVKTIEPEEEAEAPESENVEMPTPKAKAPKKEPRDKRSVASRKAIQDAEVVYARLLGLTAAAKPIKSEDDADQNERVVFRGWENSQPKLRKVTSMTQNGVEVTYIKN